MSQTIVIEPPDYERLERNSIAALNEFFEAEKITKVQLAKAKTAQGALGSVQSHKRTALGGRNLDFVMARSLTSDPLQLAEYIRITQHDSALVRALPDKAR